MAVLHRRRRAHRRAGGGGSNPSSGAATVINGFNFGDISQKSELSVLITARITPAPPTTPSCCRPLHKRAKNLLSQRHLPFQWPDAGTLRRRAVRIDGRVTVRNDISDMPGAFRRFRQSDRPDAEPSGDNERSILDRCGPGLPATFHEKYETKGPICWPTGTTISACSAPGTGRPAGSAGLLDLEPS